jgi:hypothetical protein
MTTVQRISPLVLEDVPVALGLLVVVALALFL